MSKLEISTVASRSELAALASAWQALFDDDPLAGPFLSYLWLRRWLDVFAPQGDFRVELVHAGSRLVGGLWIHCRRRFGLRSWNLVGEAHACGEFLDFVALPDHRVAVADALARHLCSQTWDCLDLEGLAPHSALAKALAAEAADRGWSVGSRESQVCPTIERCDVAAFEAAPDAVFKRIVVKSERQVGKKVTLTYETSARPDATEPLAWLDDLIRWSIEGWRARGGASAFENDLLRDFYGRFTEDALAAGLVEMRRILADGVPAAMVYGLRRGSDFYFLQSGISPLGVRHKAGNILLNRTIRETLAAGGSFHFLRGDEIYKYRWGAVDVATQRLVVCRSGILFRGLSHFSRARSLLRSARDLALAVRERGAVASAGIAAHRVAGVLMRTREYEVHEWVPDTGGPAEFLGRKALKNVHCKALDASDLHQLRFEFGAPVEADCRRRLASTRGYSAYRGGKLVCCAFVTDGDSVTCTDGSRFRITPACPGVVIHALRSVPGIDAEALGKLLAYQIETERQGEAETVRLVLEPDNADLPLAALGFRPASGLRRRIIGGSRKVDTVVAADGASRLQAVRGPAGADVR